MSQGDNPQPTTDAAQKALHVDKAETTKKLHDEVHQITHQLNKDSADGFKVAADAYDKTKAVPGLAHLDLVHSMNVEQHNIAKSKDDIRFVGKEKVGNHDYWVYANDKDAKNHEVYMKDDKGFHAVTVDKTKPDTDKSRYSNISNDVAFTSLSDHNQKVADSHIKSTVIERLSGSNFISDYKSKNGTTVHVDYDKDSNPPRIKTMSIGDMKLSNESFAVTDSTGKSVPQNTEFNDKTFVDPITKKTFTVLKNQTDGKEYAVSIDQKTINSTGIVYGAYGERQNTHLALDGSTSIHYRDSQNKDTVIGSTSADGKVSWTKDINTKDYTIKCPALNNALETTLTSQDSDKHYVDNNKHTWFATPSTDGTLVLTNVTDPTNRMGLDAQPQYSLTLLTSGDVVSRNLNVRPDETETTGPNGISAVWSNGRMFKWENGALVSKDGRKANVDATGSIIDTSNNIIDTTSNSNHPA